MKPRGERLQWAFGFVSLYFSRIVRILRGFTAKEQNFLLSSPMLSCPCPISDRAILESPIQFPLFQSCSVLCCKVNGPNPKVQGAQAKSIHFKFSRYFPMRKEYFPNKRKIREIFEILEILKIFEIFSAKFVRVRILLSHPVAPVTRTYFPLLKSTWNFMAHFTHYKVVKNRLFFLQMIELITGQVDRKCSNDEKCQEGKNYRVLK